MPRQVTDDAHWQVAIADFRRSGLTQPEFCRSRRLPLHTFRRRLYARAAAPPAPPAAQPMTTTTASSDARLFVPVTLVPDPSATAPADGLDPLVLVLDGRHRIAIAPGFDPATLRRLVDALGGRP
jgi:hypothetical protein